MNSCSPPYSRKPFPALQKSCSNWICLHNSFQRGLITRTDFPHVSFETPTIVDRADFWPFNVAVLDDDVLDDDVLDRRGLFGLPRTDVSPASELVSELASSEACCGRGDPRRRRLSPKQAVSIFSASRKYSCTCPAPILREIKLRIEICDNYIVLIS